MNKNDIFAPQWSTSIELKLNHFIALLFRGTQIGAEFVQYNYTELVLL